MDPGSRISWTNEASTNVSSFTMCVKTACNFAVNSFFTASSIWKRTTSVILFDISFSLRKKQATRRGVVYSIAPSRLNVNVLWAGTDDGLIHLTRDGGKTWKNVTPPAIAPWSKIALLDASHYDDDTVYAAVNRLRV